MEKRGTLKWLDVCMNLGCNLKANHNHNLLLASEISYVTVDSHAIKYSENGHDVACD